MKKDALQKAAAYSKVRKRRKRWQKVVTCLAAVVVFCTAYALILPAITQERQSYCGRQAHTHDASCWQMCGTVMSCAPSEHVHGDSCYDTFGNALCGYGEAILHSHDPVCYSEDGTLRCGFTERYSHMHGDACYTNNLLCEDTSELHVHSKECYGDKELTCSVQECYIHTHDASCFDGGTKICGILAAGSHVHSETCFADCAPVLICEAAEHTHNDYCYIDTTADVELQSDWEATLPKELEGSWAEKTLAIAQSQLGYCESKSNVIITDSGVTKGYTRYGAWYGDHYGDWCAMFVSFCLNYAEANEEFIPYEANCQRWVEKLTEMELYSPVLAHPVMPGDLIFFDYEDDDSADHVGIVVELIPSNGNDELPKIKTIEGNSSNCVQYREYSITDRSIMGYGDVSLAQKNYELTVPHEKSYTDEAVTIQATYYAAAQIPEEAELSVTKIESDNVYADCYAQAETLLGVNGFGVQEKRITDFRLYDICFVLNGQEIEPKDVVDISITVPNAELLQDETVTVIHYEDEGAEVPDQMNYSIEDNGTLCTSFETDSFSLFAVVTTQDRTNAVLCMSKYNVTSSNIQGLAGTTFMIAGGNYALAINEDAALETKEILTQEDDRMTASEALACWVFERYTGSRYYIKTIQNTATYYLAYVNGALTAVTEKGSATVFTAARSSTNLTLANSNSYINLNASGVSMGSSMTLSLYTIPTGEFTVTFDGQIGNAAYWMNQGQSQTYKYTDSKKWSVTTTNNGYVTLPTAEETPIPGNYPLRLNGWYDIINQVFYDSSMFGQQIRVTNNTIFYPEWIAATYDIGQNEDVVVGQPDTSDFINTYVYDYTELFNTHSANYSESSGTWTFDPDSELGFIFFDYLTSGNIGNISNKNVSVDGVTVNEEKTKGTRGSSTTYPGTITTGIANDARLEALFGYDSFTGRHYLGEGDWLYSYDAETGFYYYNSGCNAASYNQSLQRFYVYEHVVNIDSQNSLNDFLPFTYGTSKNYGSQNKYAEKDNEANYWFGMKSEIKFYLPDDSGSGNNKSSHGTDMQLRFSGDDDVWIFVDGELVLDLGGVHDVVYGEVNFSTGKVTTGQALSSSAVAVDTTGTYADMPGVTYGAAGVTTTDLPHVIEGGKEHTITIYYLERGSSLSNCAVYFNLSPMYELLITKQDASGNEMLEGAQFQVYEDEACTTPASLYLIEDNGTKVESLESIFTTGEDGTVRCWGLLPNKTYWIKEIKPPDGYPGMSEHKIKIDLNAVGEAVSIIIDSNNEEWIFADFYYRISETEHLIGVDVYNDKFVVGEEETVTSINVEKVWAEGSEELPDEITVDLLANGEATGRTMKLNAENNWKGTFYQLPTKDSEGNDIVYSVEEAEVPDGYNVSYEDIPPISETVISREGYWSTTSTLENGRIYRFVANNVAVANISDATLSPVTPSETDTGQQWRATTLGSGFLMTNVSTGRNLTISSTGATASTTTSGNNVTISLSNGQILSQATSYGRNVGLQTRTNQISSSAYNRTTHTVYVWNEPEYEQIEVPGTLRIINTPFSKTVDIPVQKLWDMTVPADSRQEVSVSLYLVTEGENPTVTFIETRSVNAESLWAATFEDIARPSEVSYYCIVENQASEYLVSYGGETVSVLINGQMREAAKVSLDEKGDPVQVEVTNSALIILPETGGIGTQWYTLGGLVLIAASILLLYRNQKRRKEDLASS